MCADVYHGPGQPLKTFVVVLNGFKCLKNLIIHTVVSVFTEISVPVSHGGVPASHGCVRMCTTVLGNL